MMSARQPFPRIFWQQCPRASIRPNYYAPSPPLWRTFTVSARRTAAAPKQAKPAPRPARPTSRFKPGNIGKLAARVAEAGELVLFKGPSQKAYMICAYSLGALCFAYAVWQSNIVFRDPIMPFPMWQQGLFAGLCVIMSGFGTVIIFRTTNMVRSITAIESKGQVAIRFTIRRVIPFMKPYTFEAKPSQVSISRRLVVSPESLERYRSDNLKIGSAKAEKRTSYNPVTLLSQAMWKLFISMRQVFTGEDFILLQVEGRKGDFRMDSKGFVADEFLALGSPVRLERRQ